MDIFDSPLLNDQKTECVFLNKAIELDDVGGYNTVWYVGAPFDAVITENNSLEATIAGQDREKTYYGVKVKSSLPIDYHTVFMRKKDNATFRITTADAMKAPSISPLGMKQLQAEEYKPVGDIVEAKK